MRYVPENPIIVQADHTILLETMGPHFKAARDALGRFASAAFVWSTSRLSRSHSAMARAVSNCVDFDMAAGDNFVAWAPMFHMASAEQSLSALCLGGMVHVVPGYDVDRLVHAILEVEVAHVVDHRRDLQRPQQVGDLDVLVRHRVDFRHPAHFGNARDRAFERLRARGNSEELREVEARAAKAPVMQALQLPVRRGIVDDRGADQGPVAGVTLSHSHAGDDEGDQRNAWSGHGPSLRVTRGAGADETPRKV